MNKGLKAQMKLLIRHNPIWVLFKWYAAFLDKAHLHKKLLIMDLEAYTNNKLNNSLFKSKTVLNGPFKGLKYPEIKSYGSRVYPKLLGSYELALQDFFLEAIGNPHYKLVIDIGCAEGYYAIGLALKNRNLKVIALDTDAPALAQCHEMARLNEVDDRVAVCSKIDIASVLNAESNILIICDCEGCERNFFDKGILFLYKKCDIVIELHEFLDSTILDYFQKLFSETHILQIVNEISLDYSTYIDLKKLTSYERELITNECRPEKMRWIILRAKN